MKPAPVDVLIIGAGAAGAAVAWSLADTKMHILCLDQGGWMNPSEYPSTGRDWEEEFYADWSTSRNIRGRPEDYPINDDNSPIKVVNFNGVGGSTVMYTAHWPRLHPSDFQVKTLDGARGGWRRAGGQLPRARAARAPQRLQGEAARRRRRRLADRLRCTHPVLRRERPDDGRLGPVGRPGVAADAPRGGRSAPPRRCRRSRSGFPAR